MGDTRTGSRGTVAKHRAANGGGRRKVRHVVFARDDICWLCLEPVDKTLPKCLPESPELDEEIPFSKGGSPTDPENVNLVHRACNQLKGDRVLPRGAFAGRSPIHGKGAPSPTREEARQCKPRASDGIRTSIDWVSALSVLR